jgi:putative copper resistance protein D
VALLIDLFGYLSIVLHGLTIIAQSMAVGGVLFLVFLARPLAKPLGIVGPLLLRDVARITFWSALGLILCEATVIAMQTAVLVATLDLSVPDVLRAGFAVSGMVKIGCGAVLMAALWADRGGAGRGAAGTLLLAAAAVELAAATLTTHAAARLADRGLLLTMGGLHQVGAAIWIGGLPGFVAALARVHDGRSWRLIGERFSRLSLIGVGCIVFSGGVMSLYYIGSPAGFYGTAYGVMVGAKIAMFLMLLGLGAGNFRLIRRLRADPATPVNRLKRFAEVEIGIGFSVFFAAASLTSVPPAVDLSADRVTWQEIVERNLPQWPSLASPDHDVLALPAQQAMPAGAAFVPGSGVLPPRNAADSAWSEYNHHWAGLFVLAIGFFALLNQAGLRWARHWPLLFLGLAVFLLLRSDPEVWPLGEEGFFESLRDVEVLQHKVFVVLIVIFALFEWRVRARGKTGWAARVFPLLTATGGALLLTHSHAIANVKDQLLIELTHTPLALLGIAAGWSRWLELRLDPPANRLFGWVWPVCFVLIAGLLLNYRET